MDDTWKGFTLISKMWWSVLLLLFYKSIPSSNAAGHIDYYKLLFEMSTIPTFGTVGPNKTMTPLFTNWDPSFVNVSYKVLKEKFKPKYLHVAENTEYFQWASYFQFPHTYFPNTLMIVIVADCFKNKRNIDVSVHYLCKYNRLLF